MILRQLAQAFTAIREHDPARIVTLRRIAGDLGRGADVVGLTIAEFIPRQFMHLQQILGAVPLLGEAQSGSPGGW